MSVDRVRERAEAAAQAASPDPLVEYDLARLDDTDVSLPPAPPAPASPGLVAATALARATGHTVDEVEAMTPDEVRALATTADA